MRWTAGKECLERFMEILGRRTGGERELLRRQLLLERSIQALAHQSLDPLQRERGRAGKPLRQLASFVFERSGWHHAIEESEPQRLGSLDPFAQQRNLHGLAQADEPRQGPGGGAVRRCRDIHVGEIEARVFSGNCQVRCKYQACARAGGYPLHACDARLPSGSQDHYGPMNRFDESMCRLAAVLSASKVCKVPAGAERSPLAAHHDHAHRWIVGCERDTLAKCPRQLHVEYVQYLGAVETNVRNALLDIRMNELTHSVASVPRISVA